MCLKSKAVGHNAIANPSSKIYRPIPSRNVSMKCLKQWGKLTSTLYTDSWELQNFLTASHSLSQLLIAFACTFFIHSLSFSAMNTDSAFANTCDLSSHTAPSM